MPEELQKKSPAKDWLRALERTASIASQPNRLLLTVVGELAADNGRAAALLSDGDCVSFAELFSRANQYARWALNQGLRKGDVVALLISNQPDYFIAWLGLSSIGCIVALLNTNLRGDSLLHSLRVGQPKHLIVGSELIAATLDTIKDFNPAPTVWTHGLCIGSLAPIEPEIGNQSSAPLSDAEQAQVTIDDIALYVFTSGTMGMPKAAKISHARVLHWAYWFAGMMDLQPSDTIYSSLPMYHSVGGVLVPGAALVAGARAVIREKFSARRFWDDIVRWDCTIIQYIGEICHYLLRAPESIHEHTHHVRLACGNGMSADVWERFQSRFQIPRILEFYASTEGGISFFNAEGEPGSIGRVPPYLAHRFAPALVRLDDRTGEPVRTSEGFCIPCGVNEPGEALGQMHGTPFAIGGRFEGYTDSQASSRKILRDVFRPGDSWVRTGDVMRVDSRRFIYFVDRIGDTFRWKGENVSATEVAGAIRSIKGVLDAAVYGVAVPFAEGRAGMAALVIDEKFDLESFRGHLARRLPGYALPLFLRFTDQLDVTGTFKHSKSDLIRQGYDPGATGDPLYVNDSVAHFWRRIDLATYECIQNGGIRW